MASHVLDQIKSRKNYYRDNYRRLSKYLFFCFALIFILIMLIVYFVLSRGEPTYYASSSDGGLIELEAVNPGTGIEVLDKQQKATGVEY